MTARRTRTTSSYGGATCGMWLYATVMLVLVALILYWIVSVQVQPGQVFPVPLPRIHIPSIQFNSVVLAAYFLMEGWEKDATPPVQ